MDKQRYNGLIVAHRAVLDRLHLTPDRLAHLKDMIVEQDLAKADALALGRKAGFDGNPQAIAEAVNNAAAEEEKAIKAYLGDDYSAYAEATYEGGIASSFEESPVGAYFYSAGFPLDPDQANAFAKADFDQTILQKSKPDDHVVDPAIGRTAVQQQFLTQLAPVLSADQQVTLDRFFAEQNQMMAYINEYRAKKAADAAAK